MIHSMTGSMPRADPEARKRRMLRWTVAVCSALAALISTGAMILVVKWPFSQESVIDSIHEIIPGNVRMASFRNRIFPHPGCDAYGVILSRPSDGPDQPPLVTVQKISIEARYSDLFVRPGFVARILLNGLQVRVPPRGAGSDSTGQPGGERTKTRVGEIVADGAVLEIARRGDSPPLKFEIHSLVLTSVTRDKPFSYQLALTNAIPPGEVTSAGSLGPWTGDDVGNAPVSGSYRFGEANLAVFPGISGTLFSEGQFDGHLSQIAARGSIGIPDFQVDRSNHTVPVRARYTATVNAINGDIFLRKVETSFLQTNIVASGDIAAHAGERGKITSLHFEAHEGRIEDVLRLFVQARKPPMEGVTSFRADILIMPEGRPFLREINLKGDWEIGDGSFNHAHTRTRVNDLSKRARGSAESDKNADNHDNVTSELDSQVVLRNGVATLTNLSFRIPGALARMNGTYNLFNSKIDFHGTLKTQAELSETQRGLKSLLLKPLNPLFKNKRAGAEVPVEMTGSYDDPHFGLDLNPAHRLGK